jgi:hypothetical protein
MKNLVFSLGILFMFSSAFTQKNISNQFHGWALYTGTHKISPKWNVLTEYQWRRSDGFQHWQQSLMRLGVEYNLNPKASVMAGYGWIRTFPYGAQPVLSVFDENRIFEQVNFKDKIGRFEFQHRYRLEQRFLEQFAKNSQGEIIQVDPVFRNRIRYRALMTVPLSHKDLVDHTLFVSVSNELFVGFGKGIAKNPIDQNRFIAALGWRFNSHASISLGYLNQFVIKTNATDMERNHSLWVSTVYNFDLSKLFQAKDQ